MIRKLIGYFRLYWRGRCPHCNSDAGKPCPICEGHCRPNGRIWRFNRSEVWERYKKWLKSR